MGEEQNYTELLKEIATLQQRLEHYETNVLPVYNEHIAGYKVGKLQEYGLTDPFWAERVTATTKAEIDKQVQALAVDLRIEQRNQPVDASRGNGAVKRGSGNVRQQLYEVGKNAVKQAKHNGRLNKHISSIKIEQPPVKHTQAQAKKGIIDRVFGRK